MSAANKRRYALFALFFCAFCVYVVYYNNAGPSYVNVSETQTPSATPTSSQMQSIPFRRSTTQLKCTERYLSAIPGGNFGNLVWEYMSVYVLWKMYGETFNLVPYIDLHIKKTIETTFESLTIPIQTEHQARCLNYGRVIQIPLGRPFKISLLETGHILLAKYSARYDDALRFGIENIKKEMRFKKEHVEVATKKLKLLKEYFEMQDVNVTFVGLHYRGTDYHHHLHMHYNKTVDTYALYKYYVKAMTFFKVKFKNVIFVLTSIDYKWLRQYGSYLRNQFNMTINPNGDSRENDFVLLSHCNHSIINYGTFGATSAFFAQGITFVYDLQLPLDHRGATVAMGMVGILPQWYKMA